MRIWLLTLLCASSAVPIGLAAVPLRYRFAEGERLIYERRVQTAGPDGEAAGPLRTEQVQLWCLQEDRAGWLILLDRTRVQQGRRHPTDAILFRITANGKLTPEGFMSERWPAWRDVLAMLPPMPTAATGGRQWRGAPDPRGERWQCRQGADTGDIALALHDERGALDALQVTVQGSFRFDAQRGRMQTLSLQQTDARRNRVTRTRVTFHSVRRYDAEWTQRRRAEARRYMQALQSHERILVEMTRQPADFDRLYDRLQRLWSGFARDVERDVDSPFEPLGLSQLMRVRSDRDALLTRALLADRWQGKPVGAWTLLDFAGNSRTSEEWDGKARLECFWSVEESLGIAQLDRLRRLVVLDDHRHLSVIAFSLDRDEALLREITARFGAGMTHVGATPLLSVEPIRQRPAFRLVDRDGIIRAVWIGRWPEQVELRKLTRGWW